MRPPTRSAAAPPLTDEEALRLAEVPARDLAPLLARARAVRDAAWGRTVTFSPKVFLPITNLCRNACDYCAFRRSPGQPGEWTMTPDEVERTLARAREVGCVEALFCLGDTPEGSFPAYHRRLATWGHRSTVDYLHAAGRAALRLGLLPHTNAGILDARAMDRLREVNVSLGLMLESASDRLCAPGMPHHRAPDKRPATRLAMIDAAGALGIPFTTGVLLGIGETRRERVEALLAIRRLHRAHGHVQEVIVQNFRAHAATPMDGRAEPDDAEVAHAIAIARLVLDPEVSVQSPPNLNAASTPRLLAAGANDLGGISPLTPDYVNPRYAWPHLDALARLLAAEGYALAPRLPVYDAWIERAHPMLAAPIAAARARLPRAVEPPPRAAAIEGASLTS